MQTLKIKDWEHFPCCKFKIQNNLEKEGKFKIQNNLEKEGKYTNF